MIDDKVSCVILTSPVPSNPSLSMILETIESVRYHMPEVPITIMADGVRPEQEDLRAPYEQYTTDLAEICSDPDANMTMMAFEVHVHQIGLMREFMKDIQRPYLLHLEHDCPLVKRPIDWDALHIELDAKIVDFVRFLPEVQIHPEHEFLMGSEITTSYLRLRQTIQFSARPHIAKVDFYRRMLERFSPEAKCFVEDGAHSICQSEPWDQWKMAIYLDPEGKDSKFSYHLDGRAGARKFDESQVF